MQVNPITQLYNDFITILDKSVIKYKNEAEKFETVETKKSADGYIMAYLQEDKFETYYRYEREVIANVMTLTDERDIDFYYYDRDKIPFQYRDEMVRQQRKYVLESYTEANNYYRCLNGLPDMVSLILFILMMKPWLSITYRKASLFMKWTEMAQLLII